MKRYFPRNDFVLYRVVNRGQVRGIAMPDRASQGKDLIVEMVGPDVKDLKPGDQIEAIGTIGEDLVRLPNDPDLFLTRQANIVLIIKEVADEGADSA